jgi:hypothetical protein
MPITDAERNNAAEHEATKGRDAAVLRRRSRRVSRRRSRLTVKN